MNKPTQNTALWLQAFRAGPGMNGDRDATTSEARQVLFEAMAGAGDTPPAWLKNPCSWIDRPAKLFEAGEYPDKGIVVTVQDLEALAAGFCQPVPVLIEHAEIPLEMGWLTAVKANGAELFGTVTLTAEANQLVERSQAYSLSLGLSHDLTAIREVSLVRRPRIPSARLFADGPVFWGGLEVDLAERCRLLEARIAEQDSAVHLNELIQQGRLTPAQAPIWRALIQSGHGVDFDGETVPVAVLARRLVELNPPHGLFGEAAPATVLEETTLTPEQAEFYSRRFPDLSLGEIAKRMN